jgi:hypothetical protein
LCRDLGDEAAGDLCAKLESDAQAGEVSGAIAASRVIANSILALKSEVVGYLVSGQERSTMP